MSTKSHDHRFECRLVWTGARHGGTTGYEAYSREYRVDIPGKPSIRGTAATVFRGDPSLPNPEDLLMAALSACHFLSYVAYCARDGVNVIAYATGREPPATEALRVAARRRAPRPPSR